MTYVISDIHGKFNKFMQIIELINFSDDDEMFILGDVIDRGNDSIELLMYIMSKNNIHMILGNHEEMMNYSIRNNDMEMWFQNGGKKTYQKLNNSVSKKVKCEIISFVSKLKLHDSVVVNDKTYILVHAGIETDSDGFPIKTQLKDFILWSREEFYEETNVNNRIIVIFGHTPTINLHNSNDIWYGNNMIGIDCGVCFNGKLGCLRLDDMKEFYV